MKTSLTQQIAQQIVNLAELKEAVRSRGPSEAGTQLIVEVDRIIVHLADATEYSRVVDGDMSEEALEAARAVRADLIEASDNSLAALMVRAEQRLQHARGG